MKDMVYMGWGHVSLKRCCHVAPLAVPKSIKSGDKGFSIPGFSKDVFMSGRGEVMSPSAVARPRALRRAWSVAGVPWTRANSLGGLARRYDFCPHRLVGFLPLLQVSFKGFARKPTGT